MTTPLEKEKIFQKNILTAVALIIDTCEHYGNDYKNCTSSCPFRSNPLTGYCCIFEIGVPPIEWQLNKPKENEITPKLVEIPDYETDEMYTSDMFPI